MIRRIVLFAAACLAAAPTLAATTMVEVRDNFFSPSSVTICVGDTVVWEWTGNNPHTTTSGDGCAAGNGVWDSGVQGTGFSFSHTFGAVPPECATDSDGADQTCSYYCTVHCPAMTGTVTVMEAPAAALGLSKNSLRVSSDPTQGRGGTVNGVEMLDGAFFSDVVDGSTELTLTLSAPGLPVPVTSTVPLADTRSGFGGRFPQNESQDLNIRVAKITEGRDPDVAKVGIKYETNNFDLTAVGPLTLTVEISHVIGGDCGQFAVVATASGPVQL